MSEPAAMHAVQPDHARTGAAGATPYLRDRREIEFFLWELFDIEHSLLAHAPYRAVTRAQIDSLLDRACAHSDRLAARFFDADRKPARRIDDQTVRLPEGFEALWREHHRDWFWLRQQADLGNFAPAHGPRTPHIVVQSVMELFFGANPSFMPYSGFTPAAEAMLAEHGTPAQQRLFLPQLGGGEWDACLCATEREAGSDLSAVDTAADLIAGDVYAIRGEKILVSAGMHPLTDNTLYVVLGRITTARRTPLSLSCFLVPRYWVESDGRLTPNHVACAEVHDKMGLGGCANTRLLFGHGGLTRGYLLGDAPNMALLQLQALMGRARSETGLFGTAVASSAYLHALRHARRRVQGARFDQSSNPWAAKVAIIRHPDVQRMLLDMKARVEGCRAIVGRITHWASRLHIAVHALQSGDDAALRAEADRLRRLITLFSPVCKAYVSEEVQGVVAQAIQVHGAAGYLRDNPLEQYARDIRVLTLWEGTTYIQAQDLVRDKLAFGRKAVVLRDFEQEVDALLAQRGQHPALHDEFDALSAALAALGQAMTALHQLAEARQLLQISQVATRFLTAFGDVTVAWNLLQAACVAQTRLQGQHESAPDAPFYRGKIKSARYFIRNVLPRVHGAVALICSAQHCHVDIDSTEFASPEVA